MSDGSGSIINVGESWIGRGNNALLRGMGVWGVAGVGIACIGLTSSGTLLFSQVVGIWPGADLPTVVAIGVGICLVLAYLYSVIGAAVRCVGADYVLASRVLHGPPAFLASVVFVTVSGLMCGHLLNIFLKNLQPLFDQIAVTWFGTVGSAELIRSASQPLIIAEVGTVLIIVAYVSMFVAPRIFQRILAAGIGMGILAWGIVLGLLVSNNSNSFIGAWNRTMGMDNFVQVLVTAEKLGFSPDSSWSQTLPAGLLVGLWIFFGFTVITALAGEVKRPERDLLRGSVLALLICGAVFILSTLWLQQLVAPDWISAESFLSKTPAYTGKTLPYITAYAGILTSTLPPQWILPTLLAIFWGWVLAFIPLIQAYIVFISRIMLAWADDGLLPEGMAYVHPRFRSPLVTMMVAAILIQGGLILAQLRGMVALPANFAFLAAITMIVPIVAVTIFPFVKKSWFEACPPLVRLKLGPLPVVTLVGAIGIVYLVFILGVSLIGMKGIEPVKPGILISIGAMVLIASGIYIGRRIALRKRNIRLADVFDTLPKTS